MARQYAYYMAKMPGRKFARSDFRHAFANRHTNWRECVSRKKVNAVEKILFLLVKGVSGIKPDMQSLLATGEINFRHAFPPTKPHPPRKRPRIV